MSHQESSQPGVELKRGRIHQCREVQVLGLQFEFGRERGNARNGTPPVGVAAFAHVADRCRHRPRSYSALGRCAADSQTYAVKGQTKASANGMEG